MFFYNFLKFIKNQVTKDDFTVIYTQLIGNSFNITDFKKLYKFILIKLGIKKSAVVVLCG
jgi:hypothetical protein